MVKIVQQVRIIVCDTIDIGSNPIFYQTKCSLIGKASVLGIGNCWFKSNHFVTLILIA